MMKHKKQKSSTAIKKLKEMLFEERYHLAKDFKDMSIEFCKMRVNYNREGLSWNVILDRLKFLDALENYQFRV